MQNLPAYCIGELIHNPDVAKYFEQKGLKKIKTPEDAVPGVALIRAHGIPDSLEKSFVESGYKLIDSTCPNIVISKEKIRKYHKEGRAVIVLGVKGHAETVCLLGTQSEEGQIIPCLLATEHDDYNTVACTLGPDSPVLVITQTTFPKDSYDRAIAVLKSRFKDIVIGNSPCNACVLRQKATLDLAHKCDAVVVVGGKNSENTSNLASVVKNEGKKAYLVENSADLERDLIAELNRYDRLGIVSGTSTPGPVIEEVIAKLYN